MIDPNKIPGFQHSRTPEKCECEYKHIRPISIKPYFT